MTYPPAPWSMHGQLWLSLFRVRPGDHPGRDPGVYAAALVSYEHPSALTYSELLVGRRVRAAGGRHVTVSDIWVDSVDAREGGRDLWAMPKDLCSLQRTTAGKRIQRTSWSTNLGGIPIASAQFIDISRVTLRTPFKGSTWQQCPSAHAGPEREVVADLSGSAKVLPCRGSWTFDEQGPLAWLAGKRPIASFRMADFKISIG